MVNGKPKGIDFIIKIFRVAANFTLTESNFRNNGVWNAVPVVNGSKKSWCGIFAVYCYKKAGFNVSWNTSLGRPQGLQLTKWSSSFVHDIQSGFIGCVSSDQHHFLIEKSNEDSQYVPSFITIDGNGVNGRITRKCGDHKVGKDNFNYYKV